MFKQIKKISLFNGNDSTHYEAVLSRDQFQKAIVKERYRSDRGDHQYSLLVLDLNLDKKRDDVILNQVLQEIRNRIRELDQIGWYSKKQLGVILPYTPREGATQLAHQICETIKPLLNPLGEVACEVFCYAPSAVDAAGD